MSTSAVTIRVTRQLFARTDREVISARAQLDSSVILLIPDAETLTNVSPTRTAHLQPHAQIVVVRTRANRTCVVKMLNVQWTRTKSVANVQQILEEIPTHFARS